MNTNEDLNEDHILSILEQDINDCESDHEDNGAPEELPLDNTVETRNNSSTLLDKIYNCELNINDLEVGKEVTLLVVNNVVEQNTFEELPQIDQGNDEPQDELNVNVYIRPTSPDVNVNEGDGNDSTYVDMNIDSSSSVSSESEGDQEPSGKIRSRKRVVHRKNWKSEVRKRKRQKGEEYEDRKGKVHRAKLVQGECRRSCKFKCTTKIGPNERNDIHKKFYSLSDTGKNHYYGKFVDRHVKRRSRAGDDSNRKFSYVYYLGSENNRIRVCKDFFLKTLDISQRVIYYFFDHVYDQETCFARSPLKGKNTMSHIELTRKETVRQHINSFPRVEAHYCRKDSKKEYLNSELSLAEMYRLYKVTVDNPVKESLYRSIFNLEFNLEFFKPRKDRCDKCEEFKNNSNSSQEQTDNFNKHKTEKEFVKTVRDKDRSDSKKATDNTNTCFVAFDLENVFSLPKAEVSNYFYKRKLNCYNLTVHSTYKGQIQSYCMIWHELISGRAGNHLASAIFKVLNKILDKNGDIQRFVLWSDACIPQNKNSIMTLALQTFLNGNPSVNVVIQRFSEPGHGVVQEVDAIHSQIERWLKPIEVFSPLSLVRKLINKSTKSKTEMNIVQMLPSDFFDFQTAAKDLNYILIPYTKVKEIILNKADLFSIQFRLTFTTDILTECNISRTSPRKPSQSRQGPPSKKRKLNIKSSQKANGDDRIKDIPKAKTLNAKPELSKEKKKDIISMLKYMPQEDKSFYTALFNKNNVNVK